MWTHPHCAVGVNLVECLDFGNASFLLLLLPLLLLLLLLLLLILVIHAQVQSKAVQGLTDAQGLLPPAGRHTQMMTFKSSEKWLLI